MSTLPPLPSDNPPSVGAEDNFGRASAYKSTVSLRFWGKALRPEEITITLGIQPQIAYSAGESLVPGLSPPAPIGVWIYFAEENRDLSLNDKVLALFQRLPQKQEIWHHLSTQYSGVISCGLRFDQQNSGQFLPATTLRKVCDRRLAIDFDLKFEVQTDVHGDE